MGNFDVPYGLASTALTAGSNIIATTAAYYHGITLVAGTTAQARVVIYDNASTTLGNLLDLFLVASNNNTWIDRYIPLQAKNGIVVSITGVGAQGAIFFAPKG